MSRLADELETSKGYLHDLAKGHRRPSIEMALKIEKHTKGKVKAVRMLGLAERAA